MFNQNLKLILYLIILSMMSLLAGCCNVSTIGGNGTPGCTDGAKPEATFNAPAGLVMDPWKNIYVADMNCNKIRQIVHGVNNVTTFAGTGFSGCRDGDVLKEAQFRQPIDIARDNSGNFYVADRGNHLIRKITPAGQVITVAGRCGIPIKPKECQENVEPCNSIVIVPDTISIDSVLFNSPTALAVDNEGDVYVADFGTCSIRKIDFKRNIVINLGKYKGKTAVACCNCQGRFVNPSGVDLDNSGNIYVSEYYGHKIKKIDITTGDISVVAGTTWGYCDGPGDQAAFQYPYHLVVDKSTGDIYVADLGNSRIRKIANDLVHTVSTLAGSGITGFNDGKCGDAQFNHPRGIEFSNKLIYVGDTDNHRIRLIEP